ncbi:MAG: thioredoxin domain-containing protein [Bacteroidota bacterium]
MKKTIITFLAFAFIFSTTENTIAQNRSIQFEKESWEKILAKARKKNKPVFMDAFTQWCGPCKTMARKVFTNDEVADFYNVNFINVKMDMDSEKGIKLRKEYNVNVYPTLLFIDGEGSVIHRAVGSREVKGFIELGKEALLPEKQLATFNKKHETGNREPGFIYEYVKTLKHLGITYKKVTDEYFENLTEKDILSEENWKIFIVNDEVDIDSKEFQYVLNNRELFDSIYTADYVVNKIADVYKASAMKMIYNYGFDYVEYDILKSKIRKSGFKNAHKILLEIDMAYYNKFGKWHDYANCAIILIDVYKEKHDNYNFLNSVAWNFYENIKDELLLERALNWAKRSVEINSNSFNIDTYAVLLYQSGNVEEAIKYEETALKLAKEENDEKSIKQFAEIIEKMKKGEKPH